MSTTTARAPKASSRPVRGGSGRAAAPRVGTARGGGGEAGGLGGLAVAIGFPSARHLSAGLIGDRRRRGSIGDRRVGNLAQTRDQLDPLVGGERRVEYAGRVRDASLPLTEADVDVTGI